MSNVPFRQASSQERQFRMNSLLLSAAAPSTAAAAGLGAGLLTPPPDRSPNDGAAIKILITSDKTWYLLPFVLVGFASFFLDASPGTIFTLNFIGMIPLARILGDFTEELAAGLRNQTVGGLLNATFGNAVEMILSFQTIKSGFLTVTKGTLLGSILSNLLLVLGMSFFAGGIGYKGKEQVFKESGPLVSMSMLLLAALAFTIPTVSSITAAATGTTGDVSRILALSRFTSVCVLASYVAFLVFQLYTHKADFDEPEPTIVVDGRVSRSASGVGRSPPRTPKVEIHGATMSVRASLVGLLMTTLLVAASSECVVSCIEGIVLQWGVSPAFIGVILLPIIGNACEHVSAIRMAMHDKPILSIGIAVGSSCQIAMFVVPCAVLAGWVMGQPMDLNFDVMNVVILALSVVIVTVILVDGKSTWIEGFMLQMTYLIVAAAYWFDYTGL